MRVEEVVSIIEEAAREVDAEFAPVIGDIWMDDDYVGIHWKGSRDQMADEYWEEVQRVVTRRIRQYQRSKGMENDVLEVDALQWMSE